MKGAKEFTGRSLDEAIQSACKYYDLPREKLEVEIINDSKTGIFGLVGAKKAKIMAREASVREYAPDLSQERPEAKTSPVEATNTEALEPGQIKRQPVPKSELKQASWGRNKRQPELELSAKNPDAAPLETESNRTATAHEIEKPAQERSRRSRSSKNISSRSRERSHDARSLHGEEESAERGQARSSLGADESPETASSRRTEARGRRSEGRSRLKRERQPERKESPEADPTLNEARLSGASWSQPDRLGTGSGKQTEEQYCLEFPLEPDASENNLKNLEDIDQEKAIALVKETLGKLLEPLCSQVEIDARIGDGRLEASIDSTDGSGLIIGREGQTLSALQYIVSRIISRRLEASVNVHLDTGAYKERQEQKLRELALRLAERVKETGRTQYTRPLSSYHRRIIHILLQDDEVIETRSKGDGAMKRVYIFIRPSEQNA